VDDFESIQEDWERILPSCSTDTIFVTPSWQKLWWRHFGDGSQLHILSVHDGDQLLGIAPLAIKKGALSFLGDTDLVDYHDFLVPEGNEEAFYGTLWEHLTGLEWHTFELVSLPEESPTLSFLPDLARRTGMSVEVDEEDVTPIAALPGSWEDYLAGLRKKDRHELRRKIRRLEVADGAEQYICSDTDAILDCMQDFFSLLKASSTEKKEFLTREREDFFRDLAVDLAPKGQFRLYFLEVDGVRVAACICFDYGGSYLLYNSGYDPEYSTLSVGLLNKALCIKEAIEAGKSSFDFLRGAERYKYHLGGQDRSIYRLVARR
jgi:CelD/BcsL family acetyltransferase involved in cellulose biosynthesis